MEKLKRSQKVLVPLTSEQIDFIISAIGLLCDDVMPEGILAKRYERNFKDVLKAIAAAELQRAKAKVRRAKMPCARV